MDIPRWFKFNIKEMKNKVNEEALVTIRVRSYDKKWYVQELWHTM